MPQTNGSKTWGSMWTHLRGPIRPMRRAGFVGVWVGGKQHAAKQAMQDDTRTTV